ncbi:MAG: AAA family ATPase [Micromonosporaceae bacterium]|nr:AAA family ATPase [Micromonosporaceae bacterium]
MLPREVPAPAFVGREHELAVLQPALRRRYPPALVLVEGEAGIGKTRLVRECLSRPALRDRTVMVAACPAVREPFPLGALVGALRGAGPRLAGLALSPLAGALRPLFPEWVAQLPPAPEPLEDANATRHRLFRALTELVERLGVQVLVVEDAHWADPATLEWLLTLLADGREGISYQGAPPAGPTGVSVVVTYRPWEIPDGSLLRRLTTAGRATGAATTHRLELGPLNPGDTRALVVSMLPDRPVPDQLTALLHQHTDGLPLAVEESVRLLSDRGELTPAGGELPVPPSIRDLVRERVGWLPEPAQQVLAAAAVLAEPADEALLAQVAGLAQGAGPAQVAGPAARRGLAAALASGLLQETADRGLGFRHVLHAKAVAESITGTERRELDRRAVRALSRLAHPPVARLCRHARDAGDIAGWSRYAEAAAELALESGDTGTAAALLHEVLTAAPHPPRRRARLARKLGDLTVNRSAPLGDLETAVRDALHEMVAAEDLSRADRGEVRLRLGRLRYEAGQLETGHAELETAAAELATHPASAAIAMLLLAVPDSVPSWPVSAHLAWLHRAARLLPRVQPPAEQLPLLIHRATTLLALGEDAGWAAAAELPATAPTLVGRRQLLRGQLNVAQSAMEWGRYQEARIRLAAVAGAAEATGYRRLLDVVQFDNLVLDWLTGTWEELGTRLATMSEAEAAHPLLRLAGRAIRAVLELAQGDRAAAAQRLQAVHEQAAGGSPMQPAAFLSAVALARLRLADGAAGAAVEVSAPAMEVITTKRIWLWATDIGPAHVEALAAAGARDRAGGLVDEFAGWVGDHQAPGAAAGLATCQAVLAEADGDLPGAAERFAAAAAAWAALPRPYDQLWALERQGRCLLATGAAEPGLAVLAGAQEALRRLGARSDADRVARVLRQHGVAVARVWRQGRRGYGDRVSPREQEVVALAARGLTNRQIGETLFLSRRTVDKHLSNAMRKLGVSSRTELAVAASDTGLLSPGPTGTQ